MLEFVKNWFREEDKVQDVINVDGTENKWTKCSEGLPHTNRKVEVTLISDELNHRTMNFDSGFRLSYATFNPHVGWCIEGSRGVVICWRDMNKDLRHMLEDLDALKHMTGK